MLPSDIARLVLGYLHDEGLENTSRAFLMESPHLEELRQNPSAAILRPSTKSLIATLEEYEDIKDTEKRRNVSDKVLTGLWKRFDSVVGQLKYKYQPSENSLEAQGRRSRENLVILRTQQLTDTQGQPKGNVIVQPKIPGQPNGNVIVQPKIQGQLIIPGSPTANLAVVNTHTKKSQAVVMPLSNVARVSIPYTAASQVFVPMVVPGLAAATPSSSSTSVSSSSSSGPSMNSALLGDQRLVGGHNSQQVFGSGGDPHVGSIIGGTIVPRQRRDSGSSMNSDISSNVEFQQLSPMKQGQDRNVKPDNTVFKSPKRKSAAPKRKQVRVPADHEKQPNPSPPPPPGPTPTEEELEEALKELPQVLETLLSNRELQQRLAGNINKALPTLSQKQDLGVPASPQDPSVGLSLSIDDILNSQMSEDTVHAIIDDTSHDPAFESVFSLFNVDKDQYMEQQREELERMKKEHEQSTSSASTDNGFSEPMETGDPSTPSTSHQPMQRTPTSMPPMAVYGKSPADNEDKSKMASTPPNAPAPPAMATVLHISEDNTEVEMESVVLPSLDGSEPQIMSPVGVTAPSLLPATRQPTSVMKTIPESSMTKETQEMGVTKAMTETPSSETMPENNALKTIPETSPSKTAQGTRVTKPKPDPLPVTSLESRTGCMVPPKKRQIHQSAHLGSSSVFKPPDNKSLLTASEEKPVANNSTKKDVSIASSLSMSEQSSLNKLESRESADGVLTSQSKKSEIFDEPSTSCTIETINAIIAQAKRDLFNPKDTSTPDPEMQSSKEQRTPRSRGRKANAQPRRFSRRKTKSPDRFSPCLPSKSQKHVASPDRELQPEKSKTEQSEDAKEISVHEPKTIKPKARSRTPKKVEEVIEQLKSPGKSQSTSASKLKTKSKSPSKVDRHQTLAHLDIPQPNTNDATHFMAALQMSPTGRKTQSGAQGSVIYTTSPIRATAESEQVSLTSKSQQKDAQKSNKSDHQSKQGLASSMPMSPISKVQVETSEIHKLFRTPEKQISRRVDDVGSPQTARSPRTPGKSPNRRGIPPPSPHRVQDVSNSSIESGPVFVPTQVKTPVTDDYLDSEPNTPQMQIVSNPNTPQTQTLTSPGRSSTPMPVTLQMVAEVVEVETSAEIEPGALEESSVDSVISIDSKDSNVIVISDDSKLGVEGESHRPTSQTKTFDIATSARASSSSDRQSTVESVQVEFVHVVETGEKVAVIEETGENAVNVVMKVATEGDSSATENVPKLTNNEDIVANECTKDVTSKTDGQGTEKPATVTISSPCNSKTNPLSAMVQSMDTSQAERTIAATADSIRKKGVLVAESEKEAKTIMRMTFPDKEVRSKTSAAPQKHKNSGDDDNVQVEKSSQVVDEERKSVEKSNEQSEGLALQCAKSAESVTRVSHRPAVVTVPCVISSGDELKPTAILQAPVLLPHVKTPAKDKDSRVSEDVQDSIKPMQALLKVMSSTEDTTGVTSTLTSSKMPLQLIHSQLNTNASGGKVRRILPKKVGSSGTPILSNTPLPGFNSTPTTSRTTTPSGGAKKNVDNQIRETPKKVDVAEIITPRQDKNSSSKSSNTRPPLRRFVKTGTPQVKSATPQSHHSGKRGMVMRSLDVGGNGNDPASTPKVYSMPRGTKGGYVVRTLDCHQPGSNGDHTPKSSMSGRSSISPKDHLAKSISPKDQMSVFGKPSVSPKEHASIWGKANIISPKESLYVKASQDSLYAKASGDHQSETNSEKSKHETPRKRTQETPRKRTPRKQNLSAAAAREYDATVDLAAEVLASCSPRKTPIKQKRRSSGGESSSDISRAAEGLMHLSTSPSARFTSIQSAGCILRNVMNAPKRNLMAEVQAAATKAKTTTHESGGGGGNSQGKTDDRRRIRGRPRFKVKHEMESDIQGEQFQTRSSGSKKDESSKSRVGDANIPQTNGDMNGPPAEERLQETQEMEREGALGETRPKKPIKAKKRKRDEVTPDQSDMKKSKKSKSKRRSFPTNMDVDKFLSQLHYPQ